MAPLTDPAILAKFRKALGHWDYTGDITWKDVAREWVEQHLEGHTTRSVGEQMYRHVEAGGQIDQVKETRPEWSHYEYHYDFRICIDERQIYVETVLDDEEPEEPVIHVVSVHEP